MTIPDTFTYIINNLIPFANDICNGICNLLFLNFVAAKAVDIVSSLKQKEYKSFQFVVQKCYGIKLPLLVYPKRAQSWWVEFWNVEYDEILQHLHELQKMLRPLNFTKIFSKRILTHFYLIPQEDKVVIGYCLAGLFYHIKSHHQTECLSNNDNSYH